MPDPGLIAAVVVGMLVIAWFFGRLRSEAPLEMALNGIGAIACASGLFWASSLGDDAFLAAAAASGGMALTAEAIRMGARRRERAATIHEGS